MMRIVGPTRCGPMLARSRAPVRPIAPMTAIRVKPARVRHLVQAPAIVDPGVYATTVSARRRAMVTVAHQAL